MDRRERINDPEEHSLMAQEGHQKKIWTALPGIIESFNASAMTCSVQPSISGKARQKDGSLKAINMPLLLDCPVCFPGGGGCTLTFPLTAGDECLVVFASRCIDSWWQQGGVQGQAEFRMHDLSDGFVIPGVRSQPRKFSVDTGTCQLRSDDGIAFVSVNPSTHEIKATTTVSITLSAPTITLDAALINLNGQIVQSTGTHGGLHTAHIIGPLNVDKDMISGYGVTNKSSLHHTHAEHDGGFTGEPI